MQDRGGKHGVASCLREGMEVEHLRLSRLEFGRDGIDVHHVIYPVLHVDPLVVALPRQVDIAIQLIDYGLLDSALENDEAIVDPELEALGIDGHERAASDLVSQKLLGIIPVGPESTERRVIVPFAGNTFRPIGRPDTSSAEELAGRELDAPSKSHTQIRDVHGSLRVGTRCIVAEAISRVASGSLRLPTRYYRITLRPATSRRADRDRGGCYRQDAQRVAAVHDGERLHLERRRARLPATHRKAVESRPGLETAFASEGDSRYCDEALPAARRQVNRLAARSEGRQLRPGVDFHHGLVEAQAKAERDELAFAVHEPHLALLARPQHEAPGLELDAARRAGRPAERPGDGEEQHGPRCRAEPGAAHGPLLILPTSVKYPYPARAVCWRIWSWSAGLRSGGSALNQRLMSRTGGRKPAAGETPGRSLRSGASSSTSSGAGAGGVRVGRRRRTL